MSEENAFQDLIREIRAGNEAAAAELVRLYEPAIRRAARIRLADSRLRRLFDSMDISQSVFASFFVRAALGDFEIGGADDLLKLLARMVRNKVSNQVDRQQAARRDYRRVGALEEGTAVPDGTPSPSRVLAARELLGEARRLLTPEELRLLEWRQQGREWSEIAAELGGSPEALRKQLSRATDRVAAQLRLDD